jgi:DnaK suppressor protein
MFDLVRSANLPAVEMKSRRAGLRWQMRARAATDGAHQRSGVSMAAKQATATATATKKVKVLTEPDLLKAPEKDYMNEAQLAFFRRRLMELRDQLLQNADDTGEHLRENETTTDPSDRATLEEEYTLELRTRDRERKLLKKVEKSIKLIDEGNYGYCEETGEPIGIPRLLARPTATLSLEAQERRERVQKLYGD